MMYGVKIGKGKKRKLAPKKFKTMATAKRAMKAAIKERKEGGYEPIQNPRVVKIKKKSKRR